MKKILVCDDDESILEAINLILTDQGYEVKTLQDSSDIESALREFEPQLILLDLWMSGSDGREITKRLKANAAFKNIPIIIISAINQGSKVSEEIQADGFIAKPFDLDHLVTTVEKFLAKTS